MDDSSNGPQILRPDSTIAAFLHATASRQPIPGGGSVAALAGALAASAGEMVLAYSVNKRDLAEHRPRHEAALTELSRARSILLELMVEDQHAFTALSEARKNLSASSGKERFESALATCIRIPQAMAATAKATLTVVQQVAPTANRYLLSDLAVCAELSMATIRAAACNVRANLPDVADKSKRQNIEREIQTTIKAGATIMHDVVPRIWKRAQPDSAHE